MKKKKHLSERLPASSFIFLSGLLSAIASGVGVLLSGLAMETISLNFNWYLFVTATWLPTIFIIIGQSILFKYQFGWSAIKWVFAGFIAILAMIVWNFAQSFLLAYISTLAFGWFLRRVPSLILALTQFVVLRQYVSRAWLWIVAVLSISISNLALYSLINSMSVDFGVGYTLIGSTFVMSLLNGIQGIVFGMVLTLLVRMTIKTDHQSMEEHNEDDNIANLMDVDEEAIVNLEEQIPAKLRESTGIKL